MKTYSLGAGDPFEGDNSFYADSSANGSYVRANFTYSSARDSISNLHARYSYDAGCAAAGRLRICVLVHGYSGSAADITDADLDAFAAYGLFAVAVGLRERDGASGNYDADGRSCMDIYDLVVALQADGTIGPKVNQGQAVIAGWSGGGGAALMCLIRFPAMFLVAAACFPLTDKWYDPTISWGAYGAYAATSSPLLTADVGVARSTSTDYYLARMVHAGLAHVLSLQGSNAFADFVHWTSDSIIYVENSRTLSRSLTYAGVSSARWRFRELSGSTHGNRADAQVIKDQEKYWSRRLRQTTEWTMGSRGSLRVLGYVFGKTPEGDAWEVYLGPSGNPKYDLTGGCSNVADLDFDTETGVFELVPVTSSDMVALLVLGSTVKRRLVPAGSTTVIEMRGLATAEDGIELLIDASQIAGYSDGATVASFREASKNAFLYTATGSPVYKTSGVAGGPSLRFNGTSWYVHSAPAITSSTKMSIAFIAKSDDTATRHTIWHIGNNATDGFGFSCNHNLDGKWALSLSAAKAVYSTAAACDTSAHLFILEYDGAGNWSIWIDGVADSFPIAPIAPTAPTTRDVLAAYSSAGAFPLNTGDLGYLEVVLGVNWSTAERLAKYTALAATWPSLPAFP